MFSSLRALQCFAVFFNRIKFIQCVGIKLFVHCPLITRIIFLWTHWESWSSYWIEINFFFQFCFTRLPLHWACKVNYFAFKWTVNLSIKVVFGSRWSRTYTFTRVFFIVMRHCFIYGYNITINLIRTALKFSIYLYSCPL